MLPRKTRLMTLGPTYLEGAGHSGLVISSLRFVYHLARSISPFTLFAPI